VFRCDEGMPCAFIASQRQLRIPQACPAVAGRLSGLVLQFGARGTAPAAARARLKKRARLLRAAEAKSGSPRMPADLKTRRKVSENTVLVADARRACRAAEAVKRRAPPAGPGPQDSQSAPDLVKLYFPREDQHKGYGDAPDPHGEGKLHLASVRTWAHAPALGSPGRHHDAELPSGAGHGGAVRAARAGS